MDKIKVIGKQTLSGKIYISGSKNSVVSLLPASILSDETVIEKVPHISDVDNLEEILKPDMVDKIPFDTNDNLKLPLAERIQIHRAKNDYLPQEATDAEIFFLVVYGHISQTINLIFVCVNYNFIPYLRYGVAFKFFTLLIGNFLNIDNTELMLNKASLSYFTKQLFNKDYVKNINIDDYKTKCMIFEKSLLKKVFNGNTLKDGLTLKKLESIIKKSLTEIVYT